MNQVGLYSHPPCHPGYTTLAGQYHCPQALLRQWKEVDWDWQGTWHPIDLPISHTHTHTHIMKIQKCHICGIHTWQSGRDGDFRDWHTVALLIGIHDSFMNLQDGEPDVLAEHRYSLIMHAIGSYAILKGRMLSHRKLTSGESGTGFPFFISFCITENLPPSTMKPLAQIASLSLKGLRTYQDRPVKTC